MLDKILQLVPSMQLGPRGYRWLAVILAVYGLLTTGGLGWLWNSWASPHPPAVVAQVTAQPREPPPSNPQWPTPVDQIAKADKVASIPIRTTVESPIAPVVAPVAAKAECPTVESPKPKKRARNVSRAQGNKPTPLIGGQP